MPRVAWDAGTVSNPDHIGLSQGMFFRYELLPLLSFSDDFQDPALPGWNVFQSTPGNVSVSNGIVSMQGNNFWNVNGIVRDQGFALRESDIEVKILMPVTSVPNATMFGIHHSPVLINGGTVCQMTSSAQFTFWHIPSSGQMANIVYEGNVWYTVRLQMRRSVDNSWRRIKWIVNGGIYQYSTVGESLRIGTTLPAQVFGFCQRYQNHANLAQYKEYREYAGGYSTTSPYVTYVMDAGAGKTVEDVDFTNWAFPDGISTNREIDYSWDDGEASYSTKYTLAQLKALGAQTGRHRYLRVRVYANSDGDTQTYVFAPNADDAIRGTHEEAILPAVEDVRLDVSYDRGNKIGTYAAVVFAAFLYQVRSIAISTGITL